MKSLIIKEWLLAFTKATFILYLLITNANIISELMRSAAPFKQILIHHFLETPKWLLKIIPVSCLVAGLFSLNNLKKRNELVPIFASGLSRKTFVIIILKLTAVIALLQFTLGGYIAPFAKTLRPRLMKGMEIHFRSNKASGLKAATRDTGKLWYVGKDYFSSFKAYDKHNQELKQLSLYYFDAKTQKSKKIIHAKQAKYDKEFYWKLEDVRIIDHLNLKDFPTHSTQKEMTIELSEKPSDFSYLESDINKLNFHQLYLYINSISKLGINVDEYLVNLYQIVSSSFLCILFSLTSIFSIFNPNRRSSSFGKNVFFILVFVIIFWLIYSVSLSLGVKGSINPLVSVFIVPLFLTFYLMFKFNKNRALQ